MPGASASSGSSQNAVQRKRTRLRGAPELRAEENVDNAQRHSEPPSTTVLDAVALFLGLILVALLFNNFAPQPYMDEPFHVGQTQKYCRGNFREWDPKITTLPGLYILGAFGGWCWHSVEAALALFASGKEARLCHVASLRAVNICSAVACYILAAAVYRKVHPKCAISYATQMVKNLLFAEKDQVGFVQAMLVTLLPTSFFFVFLYYTDIGALTIFLSAYNAALGQRYNLAGFLGALSVIFRQTNAVWVLFILGSAIMRIFATQKESKDPSSSLLKQIIVTLRLCWLNKNLLISRLWAIILVPMGFALFVVINKGIVVGDRSNHQPQLHLMQPYYFVLFTVGLLPQVFFHPAKLSEDFESLTTAFRRSPTKVLKPLGMAFIVTTYIVRNYTLVHPFLLADNRHYTFYLWKDIIAAYPAARYCLVPVYLVAGFSIADRLQASGHTKLWVLWLALSTALTLVPAWLLEFRYFTIPCVLVLLHMKPPAPGVLLQSIFLFSAVNVATIFMFLFRPYQWHDGSIARFLW